LRSKTVREVCRRELESELAHGLVRRRNSQNLWIGGLLGGGFLGWFGVFSVDEYVAVSDEG
jgi:hypothetical protein